MGTRTYTYNDIFYSSKFFFEKNGSSTMVLTAQAAIAVCREAEKRNLWVLGVDGGHWMNPGFRPDGNTSWSCKKWLVEEGKLVENNQLAIENIKSDEAEGYTAFLVTVSDL